MIKLIRGAVLSLIILLLIELLVVTIWPQTLTLIADIVVRLRSLIGAS